MPPKRKTPSRSRTRTRGHTRTRGRRHTRTYTHAHPSTSADAPANSSMRLTELQGMADSAGIAYAGMNKAQIINALKQFAQGR